VNRSGGTVLNDKWRGSGARLYLNFFLFDWQPEEPQAVIIDSWMRNLQLTDHNGGKPGSNSFDYYVDIASHVFFG
jgi:hypothetical protein